jgi:hypothetical protein
MIGEGGDLVNISIIYVVLNSKLPRKLTQNAALVSGPLAGWFEVGKFFRKLRLEKLEKWNQVELSSPPRLTM